MKTKRTALLSSVLVTILICSCAGLAESSTSPAISKSPVSRFQEADCWFVIPDGADVTCGYVSVPEDRRKSFSEDNTIRLALAVFHSQSGNPAADPIVYQVGGPGGHMLEIVPYIYEKVVEPFTTRRDLILFDPRGTGFSQPALECEHKESDGSCIRRLFAEGHNLYAYNSLSMAEDLHDLRAALGYQDWNLLGESYGTYVAQIALSQAPEGLRSVILDSVVPVGSVSLPGGKSGFDLALARLIGDCKQDSECNRSYPDLEKRLVQSYQQLNKQPIEMTMDVNGEQQVLQLTGDRMLEMLFEAMYEAPMIPYIPSAIYSASEGRNHELWKSVLLWESVIEVLLIRGANLAVSCSDGRLPDECGDWPVAIDLNPVSSTLPVLVLNGEFDSVTPLESGHHVAETLPRSFIYVFPGLGHWVNGSGHPCQMSVIQEFLEDPHHPPAVECMTEMSGPDFVVEP